MATRRYGLSPGQTEFQVTEAPGAATVSNTVELTVDLGTSINDGNAPGGTRAIKKDDVLTIIGMLQNWLIKGNFPPA